MANTSFYVPRLAKEGAWLDWRSKYIGGYSMYGTRALTEIRFVAPHHSVTHPTGNAKKDVDTLANIHINGNGWAGLGYNIVVTSEEVNGFAKAAYVGDLATVRAHTPNTKGAKGMPAGLGNRYIVAICIIGMNHQKMPTTAQLRTMKLIAQELLWFEDERMPNLWNTWDDFWPHYTWDWTQCNGMTKIRNAIINVKIPSEVAPVTQSKKTTYKTPKRFDIVADTTLVNIPSGAKYSTKVYKKGGSVTDVVEYIEYSNGKKFYRTKYARDTAKKMYGFDANKLKEYVAPAPKPAPVPVEKPVVRALGALKLVEVGGGDKVVDVITGKVTRTYIDSEPYEATHTVEYKGKTYYMTLWSYQQYQKGENPTGVDVDTVDAWVIIPEAPEVPELPPHEGEKPPVDPELVKEHDKDIADLKSRMTALEKLVNFIAEFLSNIFKTFKK